ncbi:MAG: hypothetical protein HUK08_09385, partial [Bacteroidaceae bacterium]|nr:hypothetical protein [Bacteroidaceae bacterium]
MKNQNNQGVSHAPEASEGATSINPIRQAGPFCFNQALLDNMAFFSEATWAIDMATKKVYVLTDRINREMEGRVLTFEE